MEALELYRSDPAYFRYRIPGMLVTDSGVLLTVCEARKEQSDWSMMDILLRRSTDGGKTFEDPIPLARGTERHPTVNNPVLMQDRRGRIHLLYCEDYAVMGGRVLHRISEDDGLTWGDCRDITASTMPTMRNAYAHGPGHGIRTRSGEMVVPFWRVPKRYDSPVRSHGPSEIGTLWSADDGETWHTGAVLRSSDGLMSPNETEIAELEDGRIYLNTRLGAGLTYRGRAWSPDGHSAWERFEPDYALHDPQCFGAAAAGRMPDGTAWLFFANCESKAERKNVTVKGSRDGGETWQLRRVIDAARGGYVELAFDRTRSSLYVLYEEAAGAALHLVTLGASDLSPEQ